MHLITSRTLDGRRRFLFQLATAGAFFTVRGLYAEALTLTPRLTEGPYYPDKLPLDQDNDLIRITNDITPAIGTITNVGGRLLDRNGAPINGALTSSGRRMTKVATSTRAASNAGKNAIRTFKATASSRLRPTAAGDSARSNRGSTRDAPGISILESQFRGSGVSPRSLCFRVSRATRVTWY